jgi:ApbE superfamily uncharacterized protein (UPF0280 family)
MSRFTEDKIKIIKLNIKILENALEKKDDEKLQQKLNKEYSELEKYKNSNPEFFI